MAIHWHRCSCGNVWRCGRKLRCQCQKTGCGLKPAITENSDWFPTLEIARIELEKIELSGRITGYLVAGGLFNPELMEHDKVRDLLIDCRDALKS